MNEVSEAEQDNKSMKRTDEGSWRSCGDDLSITDAHMTETHSSGMKRHFLKTIHKAKVAWRLIGPSGRGYAMIDHVEQQVSNRFRHVD